MNVDNVLAGVPTKEANLLKQITNILLDQFCHHVWLKFVGFHQVKQVMKIKGFRFSFTLKKHIFFNVSVCLLIEVQLRS